MLGLLVSFLSLFFFFQIKEILLCLIFFPNSSFVLSCTSQQFIFWPPTRFSVSFFGLRRVSLFHFLASDVFLCFIFWPPTRFSVSFFGLRRVFLFHFLAFDAFLCFISFRAQPENLMLSADHKHLKLIDFGLARHYDPKRPHSEMIGTPEFIGK